jgi:hypothetical protein
MRYVANFGLGCQVVIIQIPNEIELYEPMVTEKIHSFINGRFALQDNAGEQGKFDSICKLYWFRMMSLHYETT